MAPTTDLHLLTGAYALDALDDVERARFERHLRDCPECTLEIGEFHEATGALADRIRVAPPAHVREAVMREVARTRQVLPGSREARRRFPVRHTLVAAAAALVLTGGAALGGITWQANEAAQQAQAEASAIARVMTSSDRVESAGRTTGGGTATVVAAGGSAVFAADRLPALRRDRAYQLWRVDGRSGAISSLGLLQLRDGSGQALLHGVGSGASVAISVEPAAGSRQPTSTPLLSLRVV